MFYGEGFGDKNVKKDSNFSHNTDPRKIMCNGSTRQYYSMNWVLRNVLDTTRLYLHIVQDVFEMGPQYEQRKSI